jgi:hypothetical protein
MLLEIISIKQHAIRSWTVEILMPAYKHCFENMRSWHLVYEAESCSLCLQSRYEFV